MKRQPLLSHMGSEVTCEQESPGFSRGEDVNKSPGRGARASPDPGCNPSPSRLETRSTETREREITMQDDAYQKLRESAKSKSNGNPKVDLKGRPIR